MHFLSWEPGAFRALRVNRSVNLFVCVWESLTVVSLDAGPLVNNLKPSSIFNMLYLNKHINYRLLKTSRFGAGETITGWFLTCFKKKWLHNRINDLEIFGIVSSAVSSSIHLLLFFYLSTSISEPCTNHKKWDPPQSNFNPRSISNQQHYIGNHQNLLEEKKANFHGLYISVWDPLIDWCVNTGLKQQQQQQQQHGEARRGEARRRQTVFVYEDQVFSAADGSQRGSISHQARRSELSCPDEGVQLYIIISLGTSHTFVSQSCTNA